MDKFSNIREGNIQNDFKTNRFGKKTFRFNHFSLHQNMLEYIPGKEIMKFQGKSLFRARILALVAFFSSIKLMGKLLFALVSSVNIEILMVWFVFSEGIIFGEGNMLGIIH